MKKLSMFLLMGLAFSCNNEPATTKDATKDSSVTSAMDYPYKIQHPDYWVEGSSANTLVALNALKKWEEGKLDESLTYFADSVQMEFDGVQKKMSNDSVKAMLGAGYNNNKNVSINMQDWESVISKDKKQEWVTLWYTQKWETKTGVKDSVDIINDVQLKDGKIIRLDEYTRKFH